MYPILNQKKSIQTYLKFPLTLSLSPVRERERGQNVRRKVSAFYM